ncbi:hypothetical protein [Polaromonas hydrogenivorans]|uniref:Uncharacterized protein n=1 Tax=Polaromonas hydrogenivorans TaxID=335476 RepID=A0AAU7LZD0_9BURK
MNLNPHPVYPSAGRYVLRLHRDAAPQAGHLAGRIEHVTSGESTDFATGAQLLEWLAAHAAQSREGAATDSPPHQYPKETP